MRDLNLHLNARPAHGRILTPKGYTAIGLKAATGDQQALL